MKQPKKISPEQIWEQINLLTDKEQIDLLAKLQQLNDEKEAERKSLSNDYLKVQNGKK